MSTTAAQVDKVGTACTVSELASVSLCGSGWKVMKHFPWKPGVTPGRIHSKQWYMITLGKCTSIRIFSNKMYIARTILDVLNANYFNSFAEIIFYMHPANERRRYLVTSSFIGWAHTENDPCICGHCCWKFMQKTTSQETCAHSNGTFWLLLCCVSKQSFKHKGNW